MVGRIEVEASTPRLSEVARHLVIPDGIVESNWPRVEERLLSFGVVFDRWQQGWASVALGLRASGFYAATSGGIVVSIPRQVAKTFMVSNLLVALAVEFPGLKVVWTSHHNRTTTNTFRNLQSLVRRPTVKPFLAPGRNDGVRTANGEQEIAFRNGSIFLFGAREYGFGRGLDALDILVLDEAQNLGSKALEDMVPAANQFQHPHGALIFYMGTPPRPKVDDGEVFTAKRATALEKTDSNLFFVEFSADEDADPDDQEQWAKANPSFPKRTPLESMLRMRSNLPDEDAWKREALGIWEPKGSEQVIDQKSWDLQADPASMAIDRLTLAVDVSPDRSVGSVSLAGLRADGKWHFELDEHRAGAGWIPAWVAERVKRNQIRAVVIDKKSAAATLIPKFQELGFHVVGTGPADMATACGQFFDGIMERDAFHTDQPQMNVALSVARKRALGDAWAWNRKSTDSDITPLVSATLALWGAQQARIRGPGRGANSTGRKVSVLA